jgi:hypothetical protein
MNSTRRTLASQGFLLTDNGTSPTERLLYGHKFVARCVRS